MIFKIQFPKVVQILIFVFQFLIFDFRSKFDFRFLRFNFRSKFDFGFLIFNFDFRTLTIFHIIMVKNQLWHSECYLISCFQYQINS